MGKKSCREFQKGFAQIILLPLLLAGLIASVVLVQQKTNFLPKAEEPSAVEAAATASARPNIIVIETDDQRYDLLPYMQKVTSRIVYQGIKFNQAFATTSLCCPSRSSFFTGQYTHNHGVWGNFWPDGGVRKFNDTSTLATWLKDAGYTTSLIGKYLNRYGIETPPYVPPGWSDWHAFTASDAARPKTWYYNYGLSDNGTETMYGESANDYSTDVLRDKALNFVKTAQRPFFLFFTPFAPHLFPTVAPRHEKTCDSLTFRRPPSFNEANVSDKPTWVSSKPLIEPQMITQIDRANRLEVCSLKAVDEAIDAIMTSLGTELNNTVVIFTSDNGLLWGEHRIRGKNAIYEESIRVPLAIRYPKMIKAGTKNNNLVLNIDLPTTIAELAQVNIPSSVNGKNVNGKSLVPLFSNPAAPWRNDFLIEHYMGDGAPSSYGVRTAQYKYVELNRTGEKEFYDLIADPHELVNQIRNPKYATTSSQLSTRLNELRGE